MSETKLEPRSSLPGRIDNPEVRADLSGGSLTPDSPALNERIERIRPAALEAELKAIFTGKKTLGVGASGEAVELIKDSMERVGIPTDHTSSRFTEADREALINYQHSRGLNPDGRIGRSTLALINDDLLHDGYPSLPGGFQPQALKEVEFGTRDIAGDSTVITAQRALNRIYDNHSSVRPLNEDGVYGPGTRNRVVRYQRMMGIPESGDIDARTLNSLQYDLGIKRPNVTQAEGATQTGEPAVQGTGSQNTAVREPASIRVSQRESAEQLEDLFNTRGTLSSRDSQSVIRILANTPDMEGLQDDYRAVSGKSLIHSIRAKMESTDLEIAVAYYVRGMGPMIGFVDTRRANANIEIANDYKKITGF